PSLFNTSRTLARKVEPGVVTFDINRNCALRMRVIISPIGSLSAISFLPLPARLHEPGDQPVRTEFAQSDTRQFQLRIISAWTAGEFATIANAFARRIARKLLQFQDRGKTLLDRQLLVLDDRAEFRTLRRILLRQAPAHFVLLDHAFLSHFV